jgi:hypothetical protein
MYLVLFTAGWLILGVIDAQYLGGPDSGITVPAELERVTQALWLLAVVYGVPTGLLLVPIYYLARRMSSWRLRLLTVPILLPVVCASITIPYVPAFLMQALVQVAFAMTLRRP